MTYEEFKNIITQKFSYQTPQEALDAAKRSFFYKFNIWYHINVIRGIISCYKFSKRGLFDINQFAAHSYRFLTLVEKCGVSVKIEGLDNLEIMKQKGCVLVANHMSLLETFILPSMFLAFGKGTYILKESLLKYPYLKNALNAIHPISVKRENPRDDLKKVLQEGSEKLKRGISLMMFPQATRDVNFDKTKFNTIGHKLAAKVNAPLIPVAIKTDFQAKGGRVDRSKPVHISFGKPILNIAENRKAAYEEAFAFIAETYKSWGGNVKLLSAK
jgi:1-acyl-sn-glycerol-3-phosphate acyltransferase